MVLLYGEAIGNAVEARRLHTERFPNRRIPDSRTFSATVQRVGDHRKFDSLTHDLGGPRSDHVFEIEPEILQAIEEESNLSIRRLALCVGVSTFIVYLYHVQRAFRLCNVWYNYFESIINNGRNRNRLIGPHNFPPRLNGFSSKCAE
jgi:hypothetical protein